MVDVLISDFETLGDWTLVVGEPLTADTVNFKEGSQGIKWTSTNQVETQAYKLVTLNAVGKHFTVWIYIDNAANLYAKPVVYFRAEPITKYFSTQITNLKDGWNKVTLSRAAVNKAGGAVDADWVSITRVQIRICAKAGTTINLTFDDFRMVEDLTTGKVTLRFDDTLTSSYTEAGQRMDQYGFRGVECVITDRVDLTGYLTLAQLKELQKLGWDIISHSKTHKYFITDNMTDAEVEYECSESQRWLIDNGFIKGSRFFAPAGNEWTPSQLEIIMKYYLACSTWQAAGWKDTNLPLYQTIPPADFSRLGLTLSVDNTTPLANVQEIVDNAKTYNAWVTLYFHHVEDMIPLFQGIIDYIYTSGLEVITISDVFPIVHTLIVTATTGGTTDPAPERHDYEEGTSAVVTAIPDAGYSFSHWELDGTTSTENPVTIVMNMNYSLRAVFEALPPPPPEKCYLTIVAINGQTNPAPGTYEIDKNSSVTITTTPNSGYRFKEWLLDNISAGTDTTIVISMDTNHSVVAIFKETPPVQAGISPWVIGIVLLGLGVGVVYALKGRKK